MLARANAARRVHFPTVKCKGLLGFRRFKVILDLGSRVLGLGCSAVKAGCLLSAGVDAVRLRVLKPKVL